ncbi:unnamed protein product [Kluyveromyces dobzhanskii CBS 2104]|uniref:Small ribosomal subunit protein uS4m n=1 Tax=Kluyveromyces dobzhanskii CBS 2104 TaxID=1427455 RepID=A0A0A8L1L3_9SACH|nr:unnamed protein product [Kluyveromyces dobzhanskii CBS 2104]
MPRKAKLLNSLSRGRVRTSFNKYNLFNLYKKSQVGFRSKTLYQQKWTSKQETRAYHGEHLTESRWQTFFQPQLNSVAQLDASLSGGAIEPTPILLQTYAVLEKRLDFALFRAMFASSVRQARQFILHGNVHVNGLKITSPGYPLKAGDVFNVKPEKVLQALGAKKPSLKEALKVDNTQIYLWNKYVLEARKNPRKFWNEKVEKLRTMDSNDPKKQEFLSFLENYNKTMHIQMRKELDQSSNEFLLSKILSSVSRVNDAEKLAVKDFMGEFYGDETLAAKAFEIYREVKSSKAVETVAGKPLAEITHEQGEFLTVATGIVKPIENTNDALKKKFRSINHSVVDLRHVYDTVVRKHFNEKMASVDSVDIQYDAKWAEKLPLHPKLDISELSENESAAQKAINLPWQKGVFGRQSPSKPFFTPWKPRAFLAPFAILPHHLEISFKTCHAVYLRDPVARPGQSEVITPFGLPVHERSYMYYVRRGK